jgi:hypothetical protein
MKNALAVAGSHFTARYMVQQYTRNYYAPAMRGDAFADKPPTI